MHGLLMILKCLIWVICFESSYVGNAPGMVTRASYLLISLLIWDGLVNTFDKPGVSLPSEESSFPPGAVSVLSTTALFSGPPGSSPVSYPGSIPLSPGLLRSARLRAVSSRSSGYA